MVRDSGLDLQNLRNDKANYEQTALFEACAFKDQGKAARLVQFFLDQGVSPTQEDTLKQLPLFYAVREGHNDIVDLLIRRGSNPNHIDIYG
jgi:ankyrin repeat protein